MTHNWTLFILYAVCILLMLGGQYVNGQIFNNIRNLDVSMPLINQNVQLFSRLYNEKDERIADLPYPLPVDYFTSASFKPSTSGGQLRSLRVMAALKSSFDGQAEPKSLTASSNHSEIRLPDRFRLVLWTPESMDSSVNVALIRAVQSFAHQALSLVISNSSSTDGLAVSLQSLAIPSSLRELELEIVSITESESLKRPLCTVNDTWPCPSMIVTDDVLLQSLISANTLTTLDRFLATTNNKAELLDAAINPATYNWRYNGSWFAAPLNIDTRMLAVNKTIFNSLQLKLPPPLGSWNASDWSWKQLVEFADKIHRNSKTDKAFYFTGSDDEENKLFHMIARSFGATLFPAANQTEVCPLKGDSFRAAFQATISKLYNPDNMIANADFIKQDSAFSTWNAKQVQDPLVRLSAIKGSPFMSFQNTTDRPAIAVVPPALIRKGLNKNGAFVNNPNDAEIIPAYMPGLSISIGQSISILRSSKNPSSAWGFITFLITPRNNFLETMSAIREMPVPYSRRQNDTTVFYPITVQQLTRSEPFKTSLSLLNNGDRYRLWKPFRQMMMETAFKQQSIDQCLSRACQVSRALSLPECTNSKVRVIAQSCDAFNNYQSITFSGSDLLLDNCGIEYTQIADNVTSVECGYIDHRSPQGITILTTSSISAVLILGFLFLLPTRTERGWVKSMGTPYMVIVFVGMLMLNALMFLTVGAPSDASCIGQIWLIVLGFLLLLGSFSAATILIGQGNASKMISGSNYAYAVMVFVGFCVNVGLLVSWMLTLERPGLSYNGLTFDGLSNGNAVTLVSPTCSYGNDWLLLSMTIFTGVYLLAGFIGAAINSNVNVGYSEPMRLLWTTLFWCFIFIAQVVVATCMSGSILRLTVISLTIFAGLMFTLFVYILPKYQNKQKAMYFGSDRPEHLDMGPKEAKKPMSFFNPVAAARSRFTFGSKDMYANKRPSFTSDIQEPYSEAMPNIEPAEFPETNRNSEVIDGYMDEQSQQISSSSPQPRLGTNPRPTTVVFSGFDQIKPLSVITHHEPANHNVHENVANKISPVAEEETEQTHRRQSELFNVEEEWQRLEQTMDNPDIVVHEEEQELPSPLIRKYETGDGHLSTLGRDSLLTPGPQQTFDQNMTFHQ